MGLLKDQLARGHYPGWEDFFAGELALPYFNALDTFVTERAANGCIYPAAEDIFNAFATPPQEVCVIILGQDPYHEPNEAMGLAFSVRAGVRVPPSLRNIRQELTADTGVVCQGTDLTPWARQGVFLLNSVLTVDAGQAFSHAGHGWEAFVEHTLRYLCAAASAPLAVVLWGAAARKNKPLFTDGCTGRRPLLVLEAAHPSPLSAYRGFFGSRPFSQINFFLTENGKTAIDWQI